MAVIYKNEKGSIIKKEDGYWVKLGKKEYFVGEMLNPSFTNEFGYSGLIDMFLEKKVAEENLEKFNFNNF